MLSTSARKRQTAIAYEAGVGPARSLLWGWSSGSQSGKEELMGDSQRP